MIRTTFNNTHKSMKYIILFQFFILILDKVSHVRGHGQYFLFTKYAEICISRKFTDSMTRETTEQENMLPT